MSVPIDGFEAITQLFFFDPELRAWIEEHHENLEEITLQAGKVPTLSFGCTWKKYHRPITLADIRKVEARTRQEWREDGRMGIEGTLHRLSRIQDRMHQATGIKIRIARAIWDAAEILRPYVEAAKGMAIIGPPGVGKTTLLRGIVNIKAAQLGPKLVVLDNSNEIGGEGTTAHPILGEATRVQVPYPRPGEGSLDDAIARTWETAKANLGPEEMVGDEIKEDKAARIVEIISKETYVWCCLHGRTLWEAMFNPKLAPVMGYPDRANGRLNGIPAFGTAIEVKAKGHFIIYPDMSIAVQDLLQGKQPHTIEVGQGRVAPPTFQTYTPMIELASQAKLPNVAIDGTLLNHFVTTNAALYSIGNPHALTNLQRAYERWERRK